MSHRLGGIFNDGKSVPAAASSLLAALPDNKSAPAAAKEKNVANVSALEAKVSACRKQIRQLDAEAKDGGVPETAIPLDTTLGQLEAACKISGFKNIQKYSKRLTENHSDIIKRLDLSKVIADIQSYVDKLVSSNKENADPNQISLSFQKQTPANTR